MQDVILTFAFLVVCPHCIHLYVKNKEHILTKMGCLIGVSKVGSAQWRSQIWTRGPISEKIDGGERKTTNLILRVTKYNGFQDVCVRFSFPVLPDIAVTLTSLASQRSLRCYITLGWSSQQTVEVSGVEL